VTGRARPYPLQRDKNKRTRGQQGEAENGGTGQNTKIKRQEEKTRTIPLQKMGQVITPRKTSRPNEKKKEDVAGV